MEHDSEHPWKESLRRLAVASGELCETADRMGLAAPEREDWYGALTRHLLPQIDRPAPLVVAITGGTNTGKSAIFNHLAGAAISRVHHEATKTKHPVCLVADAEAAAQLPSLFPEFVVRPWKTEDDPLDSGTEDLLFYRAGARAPEDLPGVATSNGFPSSRSFRLRGTPDCKRGRRFRRWFWSTRRTSTARERTIGGVPIAFGMRPTSWSASSPGKNTRMTRS
jgi:hypothetical protein